MIKTNIEKRLNLNTISNEMTSLEALSCQINKLIKNKIFTQ